MGPWRVYVIFKIAKGFLYRGVYTVGRGSVYAIFEEEKGKFEKSVYARRTEIRHLGAWRVYAIFEKGQEIFQKSVYARRAGVRHHWGLAVSWRAYAIFKIVKGFLYRAYTWAGRGSVYAIFEEEKGKFEKSVYAWRSLRSGIIEGL